MKFLLTQLAVFFLAGSTVAQQVTFRGKVEDVSGTTNQFVVDCTNTTLTSGILNLNLFVGQQLEITGQWNGSTANPAVMVIDALPVAETFEIGGGAKIGDTSSFGFTGTPGTMALGFISAAPAFLPFGTGVVFIDPSRILRSASQVIGGTGQLEIPFRIPNDPTLVGVDIFGQAALISGEDLLLSNPDCKTISD